MTDINRLPDEILALIFDRLPLRDLVWLELVNHRWQSVQQFVLARISSLTLYKQTYAWTQVDFFGSMFFYPRHNHYSPHSDLNSLVDLSVYYRDNNNNNNRNATRKQSKCDWLTRKMPNITKLCLWGTAFTERNFEHLFAQWTQLEQLYISHQFEDEDNVTFNCNILPMIRRLTLLKHFALFGENCVDVSLLPQLETVCIEDQFGKLSDVIANLGPNIRHLSLNNLDFTFQELDKTKKVLEENQTLSTVLAKQVTRLTIDSFSINRLNIFRLFTLTQLNFICKQFSALTHLDIKLYSELYLNDIIPPLSQLERLATLRISLTQLSESLKSRFVNLFKVSNNGYQFGKGLSSVQTLYLCIAGEPQHHFYTDYLQKAFPALKVLRFENSGLMYRCDALECGYRKMFFAGRFFNYGYQCVRCPMKLWAAFRAMAQLEAVYRNNQMVYEREATVNFEQFEARLDQIGQRPYEGLRYHRVH